uniref:Protein E7 n=1 Tax=Human papillomavirus TaxID=10566 RepID=A0A1Q1PPC1_9PAPI|nr:E7 [Human papillomavirus]AYA94226.1 MAG: E7 protein [Human papillomavirus]
MHGEVANLQDIVLEDVNDLILPANLLSNEDLSAEAEQESDHSPYRVVVHCSLCDSKLKFTVAASPDGIRGFQQLLLGSLSFLCTGCSRGIRYGR